MATLQPVRGTQSLLGEDADRLAAVVAAFDRVRVLFGFKRVEVPVIEPTEVFARSIGETTDIVSKEMYSFEDRGGDSITLRPEFTAGIARAYISEGWQQHAPLKLATHGPAFRYERPQKGRFRQFHQLDAEVIGAAEAAADVEILAFADQLLAELGIREGVTLQLNTLGDTETRESWRAALVSYFNDYRSKLSDVSLSRLDKNPLRILDSKEPQDRAIAAGAPSIRDHMSEASQKRFVEVVLGLERAGIACERNHALVRGLDYYRHTTFEFVTDRLGAQNAVIAGGRYDGLIEALGGPSTPAVGWAAGIERLAMMMDTPEPERVLVIVVVEDDDLTELGYEILYLLRRGKLSADIVASGSVKKRFEKAVKMNGVAALALNANLVNPPDLANVRLRELRKGIGLDANAKEEIVGLLQDRFGVGGMQYDLVYGREVPLKRRKA